MTALEGRGVRSPTSGLARALIAIPQYAIAQSGFVVCSAVNASRPWGYQKLCSMARARRIVAARRHCTRWGNGLSEFLGVGGLLLPCQLRRRQQRQENHAASEAAARQFCNSENPARMGTGTGYHHTNPF